MMRMNHKWKNKLPNRAPSECHGRPREQQTCIAWRDEIVAELAERIKKQKEFWKEFKKRNEGYQPASIIAIVENESSLSYQ
mmetsp:Transcript_20748/g.37693  ORF Transcript_20748/g.37693 Transcript_20748/m.37693 type:complete len:81 (-) Transcript_20748:816-1058(-)